MSLGGGMSAEQQLQQRLLRSRLRASGGGVGVGGGGLSLGGPLAPPPPPPPPPPLLSPPSPPDSPPPGTTPAEIPAGPRFPSETWCSLCRVYCPDPVCLPCGHNFCTACIGQRLGEPKLSISCLECGATARKRNLLLLRPAPVAAKPPPLLASLGGGERSSKRPRLEAPPTPAPPLPPPPAFASAAASPALTSPSPPAPPTPPPAARAPSPAAPNTSAAAAATASRRASLLLSPTATAEGEGGGRRCEKHQGAPLLFFCEEDQSPICAHCDRSLEHRAHTVFHVERAARDYRERVQAQLEILKQEKNTLWSQKLTGEKKIQEYIEKVKTERQEIVSEFEHLHQFLKDQEQCLLTQLEEIDKEIERQKDEMVTKLSEELSRLGDVITEMEAKCKQPASEFLQDIKKNMNRCAAGQFQLFEETPKLEGRLGDFSRKGEALKETLRRFQDNIISAVEKGEVARALNDTDATLNSDVISILPLDQRNARCEESQRRLPALQYVPDMPETVDSRALVLGCDGFTSGRYFWELEVGDGEFWALGVTRDPSKKKGVADFSPEEGIWAVGLWKGQHWALTSPVTPLSLSKYPRRIRVSLDYVGECVTFTDADTEDPIFTFPPASFNGTRTHPLLWVVGFPAQAVFLRRMGVKYPTAVHEMDVLSP